MPLPGAAAIDLELDRFTQRGYVIEVTGNTHKGAAVTMNGSEGRDVEFRWQFHYYTPPLPPAAVISATAQTARSGVNRQQRNIVSQ